MTILISGPNGNLASHLGSIIPSQVIGLDRNAWGNLEEKLADCGQITNIIHAAHDFQTSAHHAPLAFLNSNICTTARLLECAREQRASTFCYISSAAAYLSAFRDHDPETLHQTGPCPDIYGRIKRMNEVMVQDFCQRNGIRWVICRVFNLYGGNDAHSIVNRLDQALSTKTPFKMNNGGSDTRDYIHVMDAARVIFRLANDTRYRGYFDVGTGHAPTVATVVEWYKRANPALRVEQGSNGEVTHSKADSFMARSAIETPFINLRSWIAMPPQQRQVSQYAASPGIPANRGA